MKISRYNIFLRRYNMNAEGITFVDDIIGDLIAISAGCNCEVTGEVQIVTEILVVVIVRPPG